MPPSRPWRIASIYTLGIWLPVLLPMAVAVLSFMVGKAVINSPASKVTQVLLASLLYGGVPYCLLAVWATWWIKDRPETQVRYLMFRAPFLMAAFFLLFAVITGQLVDSPLQFLVAGVLGAIVAIPLGYFYVFCVVLMREELGPPL